MEVPTSSRRSSKPVRARKRDARRVKYNTIGVARQQAIIASANVIRADDEEVDLSDAFQFMEWYLGNVEQVVRHGGPVPESIVIQFRDNLLSLDLSGACLAEKVEFVMNIVCAPELRDVCTELLDDGLDCTAVDAVEEVPLIDLSATGDETGCMLSNAVSVSSELSIGTTESVLADDIPPREYEHSHEPMDFIRSSLNDGVCPIITLDHAWEHHNMMKNGKTDIDRIAHYVVYWKLEEFRRLFISDDDYGEWLRRMNADTSVKLNVRCRTGEYDTQHYFKQMFTRCPTLDVRTRNAFQGLLMVSSGLAVVTTGANGCHFLRV